MKQSYARQRPTLYLIVCYGQLMLLMRMSFLSVKRPSSAAKAISPNFRDEKKCRNRRRCTRFMEFSTHSVLPVMDESWKGSSGRKASLGSSRPTVVHRSCFFRIALSGAFPALRKLFMVYVHEAECGPSFARPSIDEDALYCAVARTKHDGR